MERRTPASKSNKRNLEKIKNDNKSNSKNSKTNERSNSSTKKRKKKKVTIPQRMVENESLEIVASPIGPIRTHPMTVLNKNILLDRLKKEIGINLGFTLSADGRGRSTSTSTSTNKSKSIQSIAKRRIVVGTNSCTRALKGLILQQQRQQHQQEEQNKSLHEKEPILCILARDVRPPTMLAHIPYLCHILGIDILLLPGMASSELGMTLGGNLVSVVFFRRSGNGEDENYGHNQDHDQKIDSFVEFARSMLPTR